MLSFNLHLRSENHRSANRADYSVLLVGNTPSQSLELAFWSDHVWAEAYDTTQADRFVHGQDAAWHTTSVPRSYSVLVQHQQFTLSSDGPMLLSGAGLPAPVHRPALHPVASWRGAWRSVVHRGAVWPCW